MIYVGYQGVGKSSLSGKDNFIDLESNNFRVDGKRDPDWYKVYCNIAIALSEQGYKVFISSHELVRQELRKRKAAFIVITPSLELKDKWLERLKKRYDDSKLDKDFRALRNAELLYEQNIKDLLREDHVIEIKDINYDLSKLIS